MKSSDIDAAASALPVRNMSKSPVFPYSENNPTRVTVKISVSIARDIFEQVFFSAASTFRFS